MSDARRHGAEPAMDVAALLAAYFEDELADEDFARLNGILAQDAFARELFVQFATQRCLMVRTVMRQRIVDTQPTVEEDLDSQKLFLEVLEQEQLARKRQKMRDEAEKREEPPAWSEWRSRLAQQDPVVPVRHIVIPRALFYAAVSGMAAVLAVMAYLLFVQQPATQPTAPQVAQKAPPTAAPTQPTPPIASIVTAIDARWEDASLGTGAGTRLEAQTLRLMEGLVKLRFENEAEVIIEGPAELTPIDGTSVRLRSGRLVGHCPTPRSRGFTVHAPTAQIVDVGTEFAVQVEADGSVEAHVFNGRVDLLPTRQGLPHDEVVVLETGAARRVNRSGQLGAPVHSDARTFIREEEFNAIGRARQGSIYHEWLAQRYRLQRDESLVAYYDFTREDDHVPDLSRSGYDATVIGGLTLPGRFAGTQAMAFMEPDHGLSVHIPGNFPQATFIAWVMLYPQETIDSPPLLRGILLPDEPSQSMRVHWQVDQTLRHRFGYFTSDQQISLRPREQAETGRWQCVAIVFDLSINIYRIYVDGREMIARRIESDEPLRIGWAGIGNWALQTRPLIGAIDEMWIFERAMSARELRALAQLCPR